MIDMWTDFQSMAQPPTCIVSAFSYGFHPLYTKPEHAKSSTLLTCRFASSVLFRLHYFQRHFELGLGLATPVHITAPYVHFACVSLYCCVFVKYKT
jgi:hypothetical protein